MFEPLKNETRLLLEAPLWPIQGDRFQPTGFADLGAAVYERPVRKTQDLDLQRSRERGTVRMLLVESAQSMANRMEAVCLDGTGPDILPELAGLPYVRVQLSGASSVMTSSLIEAHRINSPFIISDDGFKKAFQERSGYRAGQLMDWPKVAAAIFYYDPSSILHGVFMANLEDGRLRLARALSAFIQAEDVREADSGGVKNNSFDPEGKIRVEAEKKDVYGNVPYRRTEFTAGDIRAYFNLDLSLLRSYRLPQEAQELLLALAQFKIQRFLRTGLRLRTSCDLRLDGQVRVTGVEGYEVPAEGALLEQVHGLIKKCAQKGFFAQPPVTELKAKAILKAKKEDAAQGG